MPAAAQLDSRNRSVETVIADGLAQLPAKNAKKYQALLTIEEREFTEDIKEVDYRTIPLLDKDSAALLGNRKLGSLVDMVSQFEVDDIYTQINYKDNPVRVSPLRYASLIKWFTNRKNGIPAHIIREAGNPPSQELIDRLLQLPEYHDCFLSAQEALLIADNRSLVVVVDTNRPE